MGGIQMDVVQVYAAIKALLNTSLFNYSVYTSNAKYVGFSQSMEK